MRDQLWAEAVAAFRAGEKWHLSKQEETAREKHAISFQRMDPWTRYAQAWTEKQSGPFTVAELLTQALGIQPQVQGRDHQMRAGHILRNLGYTKRKARRDELPDGSRPWLWFKS